MIPYLAVTAGVPESTFQSAPNDVNLKQFGNDVNALKHWNVSAKSSNYSMTDEDDVIIASAGAQITLPNPATRRRPVYIKRNDTVNNIPIVRYGSENIDGSASDDSIAFNLECISYISDGTNWWRI
jgi:hypothetical protein